MRKLILILAILAILPSASALDTYYNITATYDKGEVTLDSISIVPLTDYDTGLYTDLNDFMVMTEDAEGVREIYYMDFNLKRTLFFGENGTITSNTKVTLEKNTASAYFPYDEDATMITINDASLNTLLEIELKAPEGKAITEETALPEAKKKAPLNYILAAALAIIILIVLWLALRRKNN